MLLLSLLLHLPCALAADPGAPAGDPAGEELVAAFAEAAPAADHLFLLDTSISMLPTAEAARADLARFVEALPAGDTVEVVAFHTRPSIALPATKVTDDGRAELVAKVHDLELAAAKDQDLGAGVAYATGSLNRTNGAPVQFLYVLSNFCHDPAFQSDWDSGGRGCRAIRGLDRMKATFKEGRGDRLLLTTLFAVTPPRLQAYAPGIEAVEGLFDVAGEATVATVPFGTFLAEVRAQLPVRRLRPLAAAEASRFAFSVAVERAPDALDPTGVLRLSSGLQSLDVRLSGLQVLGHVGAGAPTEIVLAPDARLPIAFELPAAPVSLFPGTETLEFPITVRADGTLLPEEGLRAAGIDPARPGLEAKTVVTISRSYGLPLYVAILTVLGSVAFVGFVAVFVRARLRPRRLGGSFVYRKGTGPRRELDIGELDEAAIVVRGEGELGVGRRKDAILVLRMRRPFFRTFAEVEIRASDVEINRKKVAPGRHRIVAGTTSFQFGDFRLTWE